MNKVEFENAVKKLKHMNNVKIIIYDFDVTLNYIDSNLVINECPISCGTEVHHEIKVPFYKTKLELNYTIYNALETIDEFWKNKDKGCEKFKHIKNSDYYSLYEFFDSQIERENKILNSNELAKEILEFY